MKRSYLFALLILLVSVLLWPAEASAGNTLQGDDDIQLEKEVFALLNLDRPGLEKVKANVGNNNYEQAAKELLNYYCTRKGVVDPDINLQKISLSPREKQWADDALSHTFYVHDGYQPPFNYGKDINWKYWPVKDNELRWQLHRMKWMTPMGKAYRTTGDEKYAKEWRAIFMDWIRKNQMGDAENDAFAWRPLEVSHRLQDQIHQFRLFLSSPSFTPDFLTEFLLNYYRHAHYLLHHYSEVGNHLLFESQRMFFAGTFFPEFKEASQWQQSGISNLNREIQKQVYPDGAQFELDPHYHLACIEIFLRSIEIARTNNKMSDIPQSYIDTVEKMITFYYNICFPDYTNPCFSDAKQGNPKAELQNYRHWSRIFPNNPYLKWFATKGKEGQQPDNLSKGFLNSGFFVFRTGWTPSSLVMVVKAGPKGEWHSQPDNGTFDLWFNGRNLFPDSGSYIYDGDGEVHKQRQWFRQSCVHNTLTLDNRNFETTNSKTILWQPEGQVQTLVTQNESYKDLTHRRTVFFVDNQYFVIVDEASGKAQGTVNIHYLLTDGKVATDQKNHCIRTQYPGESNVMIQAFSNAIGLEQSEGWYSLAYRQKTQRPSFAFNIGKEDDQPVSMITVVYPKGDVKDIKVKKARILSSSEHALSVELHVGGVKKLLQWNKIY